MGIEGKLQVRDLETIRIVGQRHMLDVIVEAVSEAKTMGKIATQIYISPEFHREIITNPHWFSNPNVDRIIGAIFGIEVQICPLIQGMGFIIR